MNFPTEPASNRTLVLYFKRGLLTPISGGVWQSECERANTILNRRHSRPLFSTGIGDLLKRENKSVEQEVWRFSSPVPNGDYQLQKTFEKVEKNMKFPSPICNRE